MNKSEAYINGWFAHKNQASMEANPYISGLQSYSHLQWLSGWCDRFNACKHGLDMSLDDMDM